MLEDKLTARVIGLALIGFPCLMVGSTVYLTNPALRNGKLYLVLAVMTLPIIVAGIVVMFRANRLKDDGEA